MAGTLQTQLVVFICIQLLVQEIYYFYIPHVQLSTIDPGAFFEQSKSTCHNDAFQEILYWFVRRNFQCWVQNQTNK